MEERFPSEGAGPADPADGHAASGPSPAQPGRQSSDSSAEVEPSAGEEVDGQLVALEAELTWGAGTAPGAAVVRRERSVPVTLLPAVAAGSFAAGAAVMTYVHRRRTPPRQARRARTLLRGGGGSAAPERLHILGSRSLLLDVHLLGKSR